VTKTASGKAGNAAAGETGKRFNLNRLLDRFIPQEIQVRPEAHRRARMFMLSHIAGPIIGNTLPLYMVTMGLVRDYRAVVFFVSILLFWAYPLALKRTGRYQLLAFLSVQNLIFCVLWACFAFGGVNSPFLSWVLIFPLLAFLYLPPRGWIRNLLLGQMFGSLGVFLAMYTLGYRFPAIDIRTLETIGMISTAAVSVYFAMMALYFARMLHEQREFTTEINSLISTSDNLRSLTAAANQASAAKANFVASMSHELRTPLNAILGYSQMLLEEAHEEQDEAMAKDLGHIHKSGSDLLRIIDDILDYSRIEAGKMPVNPTFDSWGKHIGAWDAQIATYVIDARRMRWIGNRQDHDLTHVTDWTALGSTVRHLIIGILTQNEDGCVDVTVSRQPDQHALVIKVQDTAPDGEVRPIPISPEVFVHVDDATASKYGGTGIEIALSLKFAQLLGGDIQSVTLADGSPATLLTVPDLAVARQLAA